MKKVLLDTNAYSQLLCGDKKVLEVLSRAEIVYMSIFVAGELFSGFKGGNKEVENKEWFYAFIEKPTVEILEATLETSDIFGMIKYELKKHGAPISINDVWIAAHAVETGSVLITYDNHFSVVPGLRIWEHLQG